MKSKSWIMTLGIFAIVVIILLVVRDYSNMYPAGVKNALIKAGENQNELKEVINHYVEKNDSLKLQAAYYLVENMEGHSYVIYGLHDSTKADVNIDVLAYPDYKSLIQAWDEKEKKLGTLDFSRDEIKEDLKNISADFLIHNIEMAFSAWQEKPWAKHLSFENFCEYVLPYRGSNEPLEKWRPHFWEQFKDLSKNMANPEDPIEATRLINNKIKSWFSFDPRFYRHPTDQGLSEMLKNKLGRCEDMTNLAIYAMRANGLAVTSDYTPHWADAGNNHAWNAILDRGGKVTMFMGGESNPGDYRLHGRLAKVYRKTYSLQKQNLVFQKPDWEKAPRWLSRKNYKDVTSDYTDVSDVTITLEQQVPDSVNYAYLCVFNDGEWKAIHWGKIEEQKTTFDDMGGNIAYLPMYYAKEKLIPAASSFILEENGELRKLIADEENTTKIKLLSTTRRKLLTSTDGIAKASFELGRNYELYYWQEKWVSLGKKAASHKPLTFDKVPADGLYWLVAEGSRKDERIFTIEDGKQIWW
ncbi:transglutaminase domain-containing protein [candidate division KSB1 bacterium]|nr:transglutaminase domain-containing protein [candidate division KSB1 bacterium]